MRRIYSLLALLACALTAGAQNPNQRFGFEYGAVAKVVQGTDTLAHAWAGGLNTPQFSSIELNGDGQPDLFVYERLTQRVLTFLNVAAVPPATGRRWVYAPDYESLFPTSLESWALLRDYNCDGRPDIFTASNGNVRVLRNVAGAGGRPAFVPDTAAMLYFRLPGVPRRINLAVGGNLPAIQDVSGDGRLDIVTYNFDSAIVMELYLNTSTGSCGGVSTFARSSNYWGEVAAVCSGPNYCSGYLPQGVRRCRPLARINHTPFHNVLLLDLDGNGSLDVLDGRDGCAELNKLLNQGTSVQASFARADTTNNHFPSTAAPLRAAGFPAPYSLDTNFDGRPDLVVASSTFDNAADRVSLSRSVALYENTAPAGAAAPTFVARPQGFLQQQMLDVSEAAAPAFGDLDGDNLPDMLVGNQADTVGSTFRASLRYYRNVGTRRRPVFRLVTTNYLGLLSQDLLGMKPVLVDLNRDNTLDLAFSAYQQGGPNFVYYILNSAAAGQPAVFNLSNLTYIKGPGPATSGIVPYTAADAPCFTDVDGDGYVDLLMGTNEVREPGWSLRYFRQRPGVRLDTAFVRVDADFGRIRVPIDTVGLPRNPTGRPINLAPAVADFDGDGRLDLLVVDGGTGTMRFFSDYRSQSSIFTERTDLFFNATTSQYETYRLGKGVYARFSPTAADLDGDGSPELYLGTENGGVVSFRPRNRGILASRATTAAQALGLTVYPNPVGSAQAVQLTAARPVRVAVLDLLGRTVRPTTSALAQQHTLPLAGLAAGTYLLQATTADGHTATQRLVVE